MVLVDLKNSNKGSGLKYFMGARKVILLRHGITQFNIEGKIQGIIDEPLLPAGLEQAKNISKQIAKQPIHRVISSPLQRAKETAKVVAERLATSYSIDLRLQERAYGQWEGKSAKQINAQYPEIFQQWRDGKDPQGLGFEPRSQAAQRIVSSVSENIALLEDNQTLLVISHGGIISAAMGIFLGCDADVWFGVRGIDNCHFGELLHTPRRTPKWCVASWNIGD